MDKELENIRNKRLQELRKLLKKNTENMEKIRNKNSTKFFNKYLTTKAKEVLNQAQIQNPTLTFQVKNLISTLISKGEIKNMITGKDLYDLFLKLGLKVKLKTNIKFLDHGKLKSFKEKLKEDL